MSQSRDWQGTLREAVEQIKTRYDFIGRQTGASFLGVVYPPEVESAVLREWKTLTSGLGSEFEVRTVDVLAVTMLVVDELGSEAIADTLAAPMPGSNPEAELGQMWVRVVVEQVKQVLSQPSTAKLVVVLEHLSALYPVTSPQAVMKTLEQCGVEGLVVFLIPGKIKSRNVYSFINQREHSMYRGDLI
jgi:hypothetical protein